MLLANGIGMKTLVLVVGYDRSELSEHALAHALAVARGAAHAKVIVAEILQIPVPDRGQVLAFYNDQTILEAQRATLTALLANLNIAKHVSVVPMVRFGEAARELCELAIEEEADFIFVGTHGRTGLAHLVLGSVAEHVVQKAPCSVIAVRTKRADLVPRVEPPCAECTQAKQTSGNPDVWCAAHTHHRTRPVHVHYQYPEHFARGWMNLRVEDQ
jgi:nucleotide-binding universal stress UspA family protein